MKRYNLTSLRRREAVQSFFGRPWVAFFERPTNFLRFCGTFTSCVTRRRLRFLGGLIYDVLDEGNEPDKLLQDEMFAVEGLEISGLMEADMDSSPVLKYFET